MVMKVERAKNDLVVNALPDGSRVIIDSKGDRVFALNATAGAAWDACGSGATVAEIAANMRLSLNPAVTEEMAEEAIARLQEQNLVIASNVKTGTSRRQMLFGLGAIALPLVVSMTLTEQKAYAETCGSGKSGGSETGGGGGDKGDKGDDGWNSGEGDHDHHDHHDHLDYGGGSNGWYRVVTKVDKPTS